MAEHPSLLTSYLDEFQHILAAITNYSQLDTQEFRKFHKDLNRLIGTVRIELIQLDRIMTIMQTNSPAPVKLAKMYEELTTITVEVIIHYLPIQHLQHISLITYTNHSKLSTNISIVLFYYSLPTHSAIKIPIPPITNILIYMPQRRTPLGMLTEPTSLIPQNSPSTQVELVNNT